MQLKKEKLNLLFRLSPKSSFQLDVHLLGRLISSPFQVLDKGMADEEDLEEMCHAQHFILVECHGLGCMDGILDLSSELYQLALHGRRSG